MDLNTIVNSFPRAKLLELVTENRRNRERSSRLLFRESESDAYELLGRLLPDEVLDIQCLPKTRHLRCLLGNMVLVDETYPQAKDEATDNDNVENKRRVISVKCPGDMKDIAITVSNTLLGPADQYSNAGSMDMETMTGPLLHSDVFSGEPMGYNSKFASLPILKEPLFEDDASVLINTSTYRNAMNEELAKNTSSASDESAELPVSDEELYDREQIDHHIADENQNLKREVAEIGDKIHDGPKPKRLANALESRTVMSGIQEHRAKEIPVEEAQRFMPSKIPQGRSSSDRKSEPTTTWMNSRITEVVFTDPAKPPQYMKRLPKDTTPLLEDEIIEDISPAVPRKQSYSSKPSNNNGKTSSILFMDEKKPISKPQPNKVFGVDDSGDDNDEDGDGDSNVSSNRPATSQPIVPLPTLTKAQMDRLDAINAHVIREYSLSRGTQTFAIFQTILRNPDELSTPGSIYAYMTKHGLIRDKGGLPDDYLISINLESGAVRSVIAKSLRALSDLKLLNRDQAQGRSAYYTLVPTLKRMITS